MMRLHAIRLLLFIPLWLLVVAFGLWPGRIQAATCPPRCSLVGQGQRAVSLWQAASPTSTVVAAQAVAAQAVVTQAVVTQTATTPAATQNAAAQKPADQNKATARTVEQRRVKVNFFINSISNVSDQAGSYDLDFYLDFYWHEPALEGTTLDKVDQTKLWDPHMELINGKNVVTLARTYANSLEPDTNLRLSYRVAGTFTNKFDLHKFPFDQQVFTLKLESADYDATQLLFDFIAVQTPIVYSDKPFEQPLPKGKYIATDFALDEWLLTDAKVIQQIHLLPYDKSSWAQFRVDFLVTRNYTSYLWKIILELVFLLFFVWGALFLDSQELRYRLLLLFVLVLATVTFDFTILQVLPKIPYLTFLDTYLILCYSAIGMVATEVILVKFLHEAQRDTLAIRLNRIAFFSYPVFFVGANLVMFWVAFQ